MASGIYGQNVVTNMNHSTSVVDPCLLNANPHEAARTKRGPGGCRGLVFHAALQ